MIKKVRIDHNGYYYVIYCILWCIGEYWKISRVFITIKHNLLQNGCTYSSGSELITKVIAFYIFPMHEKPILRNSFFWEFRFFAVFSIILSYIYQKSQIYANFSESEVHQLIQTCIEIKITCVNMCIFLSARGIFTFYWKFLTVSW